MTRHVSLAVIGMLVACGSDPPKTDAPARPADRTEVKMEAVGPADAGSFEPMAPNSAAPAASDAPPADPSDDPNLGGPQEATVEAAVAPIRPRLRACYKKALAAQPDMNGSVTFDTTMSKDGHVASARFVKKDGNLSDDFVSCLTSAAKAMQFAPDRKSQVVAFSFGKPAPTATTGGQPASIASGRPPPTPAAPVASFGGAADAGPLRH